MRYVDAGYAICLTVLFLYAVGLVLRHRRLTRAAALAERDEHDAHGGAVTPLPDGDR